MDFLENLNDKQLEAVTTTEGPLLVVAGAGSGKTKALVARATYLLKEKGIRPYQLLAITFTNKAAGEMKERMAAALSLDVQRMWIGTFHSICLRILRREAEYCDFQANFNIYDDGDQQTLLKKCMQELGISDKLLPPRAVSAAISRAKNDLHIPAVMAELAGSEREQQIARIYRLYQQKLEENNCLDFDDLIMQTVRLFRNNKTVLERYQDQFRYIMVDEYQDTNHSQYILVKLLAEKYRNLCVVGDPDQSIYRWRGADIQNILDFESDYPDAKVVKLERNYRSTQNILDAANAVIAHNPGRPPKTLWTEKGKGKEIIYYEADSDRQEAAYIVDNIFRIRQEEDRPLDAFAVLYRTHAQSRVIEDAFVKNHIPYRIFGGMRFYERKEVKDSLAYLRILSNPRDNVSFLRIINEPRRGLGAANLEKLAAVAEGAGVSLYEALADLEQIKGLTAAAKRSFYAFWTMMESIRAEKEDRPVAETLEAVWKASGYYDMLQEDSSLEGAARLENLGELLSLAVEYDTNGEESGLDNFLANLTLATDMDDWDESAQYVVLMTLHSAKGLEFPVVFLSGMEENLFPHANSLCDPAQLEEERRLCYVGITRAEERLFLTRAKTRMHMGSIAYNPESRFMKEIPAELLRMTGRRQFAQDVSKQQKRPAPVKRTVSTAGQVAAINVGDRVQHSKFGVGVVVKVSGIGEDAVLNVAFPDEGVKALSMKYAPIKKL